MTKTCPIKIGEGDSKTTCGKKGVKAFENSTLKETKYFCKDHGPWNMPYTEGTWVEKKD
jgi:hypothetical protein